MCMSTSGCFERASAQTQRAASTPASASNPIVFGEPQPQVGASLTATSSAISQPESSAAPAQWTLPGARIVDSGIRKIDATVEISVTTSGIQNSQW